MSLNSNAMAFVPGGRGVDDPPSPPRTEVTIGGANAPVFNPSAPATSNSRPSSQVAGGDASGGVGPVLTMRAPGDAAEPTQPKTAPSRQQSGVTMMGGNDAAVWGMPSVAQDIQKMAVGPSVSSGVPTRQASLVNFTDHQVPGLPQQQPAFTVMEQSTHAQAPPGSAGTMGGPRVSGMESVPVPGGGAHQVHPGRMMSMGPSQGGSKPPQFHHYAVMPAQLPDTEQISTNLRQASSFFVDETLKQALLARSLMCQHYEEPSASTPNTVHTYHSLMPLEDLANVQDGTVKLFGYPLTTYKATNAVDGLPYVLRRLEGFRLTNKDAMIMVERIKAIPHPNIVNLREVFTSKDFGDHSLVFAYDYHPGAKTLEQKYFATGNEEPIEERVLWSHIIQLSSALRVMHNAGLACRVVHPSKILVTGKNRLRFNCVGVFDVMGYDPNNYVGNVESPVVMRYKQDDLLALGRLIVALACGSQFALQKENLSQSLEFINHNYSNDVIKLTVYLLGNAPQQRLKSVNELMPFIGARFYHEIDASSLHADAYERELTKELDNGRLLRLVVKLGFINERPEFQRDSTWSETGDRYLLKLFRDYVFHQVSEDGKPILDLGHVIQALNKLDAGTHERICLMSADGETLLIVSFSDLKRCITQTMAELKYGSARV